ncbi:MAG: phosphoribosylaminoimidazolesuccinocarboxamide synthase [bacterium]|nr:phosphoribosylaminoimidazolesuccinocarboxamide synthase [bacterium]
MYFKSVVKERYSRLFPEVPEANLRYGLATFAMPEWGNSDSGKVRENWVVEHQGRSVRAMVTTDRKSAFDKQVATSPDVGKVLNLLSAFWFEQTRHIVPNHMLDVPHPNVLIAQQVETKLPVEVILRRYMAKSTTSTSVYKNYAEGRRSIYGLDFPDGLRANEVFPTTLGKEGIILTPTTKAEKGKHDEELNDLQARVIVDDQCGEGMWDIAKEACLDVFHFAATKLETRGIILVDTKIEMGVKDGRLMIIDELLTPDSSRFWLRETYQQKFEAGEVPDTFDKELLRGVLAKKGFNGQGSVPVLELSDILKLSDVYRQIYDTVTGRQLPLGKTTARDIRRSLTKYFGLAV